MPYSHTLAWDAANPLDTENSGLGASRIRDFKDMIQDRMQVGHTWGDSQTTDGEHKYDKVVTATGVTYSYAINLQLGRIFFITLSGDTTIIISDSDSMSATYSRSFLLAVKQSGWNVFTLTFPPTFKFHNNQVINVSQNANWVTVYHVMSFDNGTHWIITHVGDFEW